MAIVFLMYALFASVFCVAKYGLEFSQPFFLVGSRMLLAGCLLLAYQYFFNRSQFSFRKELLPKLIALGMANIYLTNAFEFWGLQYLSSAKTCFIYSLSPLISAVISYFVLSEVMTRMKWLGLALGFLGFVPLFAMGDTGASAGETAFLFFTWPELSVMLAASATVYGWIVMRQLVTEHSYCHVMANGVSMLIGGVFSLSHSLLVEDWNPLPVTEYGPYLQSMSLQILISSVICYNLYGYLLKHFSAPFLSFAGFSTPFFTAMIAWWTLGEIPADGFWLSAVIVLLGLSLFYYEELRESGLRQEEEAAPMEPELANPA